MKANSSTARTITALMAATTLCGLAAPALAQRGSGGGGGMGGGPGGQAMPTPTSPGTMDRMRDQDRLRDNTGDQDQDRDRDQDRLRDRDRIHVDQAVVGQMASWQLLSDQERMQFHARMRSANTAQERNAIRSEYQNTIRQRAGDLGVSAPFGPQRPGSGMRDGYYLSKILTEQERLQFHNRMRAANSVEERNRIRTEMQTTARERAQEMGIEVPAWFAGGPNKGQ
ncbi:MAG: hypothetical protein CMH85_03285 [Novosphingobium sp.]|nr:hypothetical protein [Novosphingobium sp.]|tara:strand:- start:2194 stop:2871 length:678 start_codon:yes stop_codon:yes gene_type:complete